MSFASMTFLIFFFPITLLGYYLCFFSKTLQRVWLFLASLAFCAFGTLTGTAVVLVLLLLNGVFGIVLGRRKEGRGRAAFLLGIICNMAPVIFFKYIYAQGSLLPVGLSFVMLSGISYLADVYSKETPAVKNPVTLGLYLFYFPKLTAGPAMRFEVFQKQLLARKMTLRRSAVGCSRFVTGLAKKVLLADTLAQLADIVFNYSAMGRENATVPILMAWIGLLAFALQIYFDVSGYADMAVGLSLMFGIILEENMNYPYTALSVSGFWNRFYISLTKWFGQYVYEPLGGSRQKNMDTMVRNLFLTWLAIGLWYGVSGKFLMWCLWQFLFILAERFIGYTGVTSHKAVMRLYTLVVIALGWVVFRAVDLYQAGQYYMNMFGVNFNGIWNRMTGTLLREYWMYLAAGIFFCTPVAKKVNNWLVKGRRGGLAKAVITVCYPIVMLAALLLSVSYLMQGLGRPFLYSLY